MHIKKWLRAQDIEIDTNYLYLYFLSQPLRKFIPIELEKNIAFF